MSNAIDLLIVDDAETDAFLLKKAFETRSPHLVVRSFDSGEDTLEFLKISLLAETSLPRVILLDINMPVLSGYDVLKVIKSEKKLAHIPVVMFSTSEIEGDIIKSYELGANAYIQKPSGFDLLLELVDDFSAFWFGAARYAGS